MRWVFLLAIAATACEPVLGTNDTELAYRVVDPVLAGHVVLWRLFSVGLTADIETPDPTTLIVRIDARFAPVAERMIEWDGHLTVRGSDGKTVDIVPNRGAHADGKAVVIPLDRTQTEALLLLTARDITVEVFGRPLWHGPAAELGAHELSIPYGSGIEAYRNARKMALILGGPPAPPMARGASRDVGVDWPLAIGSIALPLVTALLWIGLIRRLDRSHPEPWWLVLATFGLGAVANLVTAKIELGLWHLSPYFDPRTMSLDHGLLGLVVSFAVCTVVVGGIEEAGKLLAVVCLARRRREFDEPVDGIVYAAVAAIGFAAMENVSYFTLHRLEDGVSVGRSLDSMSGHMMVSAIWGYALGQQLVRKSWRRLVGYFALAAALHGAWDTACDFAAHHVQEGLIALQTVLFALLLRRALRWGIAQHHAQGAGPREVFPVGRGMLFVMAVLSMYAVGHVWLEMSYDADFAGQRLTTELAVWSAFYGLLFATAALVASRALPLDIIVDDVGVTFAGSLHPWHTIRHAVRDDRWVIVLQTTDRDVRLAGTTSTMDRLEAAVKRKLDERTTEPAG